MSPYSHTLPDQTNTIISIVNLLPVAELLSSVLSNLLLLLCHKYPKVRQYHLYLIFNINDRPQVRTETAEAIYLALQTKDITFYEEAEEILLDTDWFVSHTVLTQLC